MVWKYQEKPAISWLSILFRIRSIGQPQIMRDTVYFTLPTTSDKGIFSMFIKLLSN